MASEESEKVTITLRSSDGQDFVVDEAVAMQSQTIHHLIEDGCTDGGIPLHNVNSETLTKVIGYCKKHVKSEEDLETWDAEFIKVELHTLYDLLLAANYLDVKGLLDLTCQAVADRIKGKKPEEIRKTFNIENNFTPKEEEEIRRVNQWAFE